MKCSSEFSVQFVFFPCTKCLQKIGLGENDSNRLRNIEKIQVIFKQAYLENSTCLPLKSSTEICKFEVLTYIHISRGYITKRT